MLALVVSTSVEAQRETDFNFGWRFQLDAPEAAHEPGFDDSDWRAVDLPHDWVIEGEPDPRQEFWQATGRLPGKGVGWYRKRFTVDSLAGRSVQVVFDGVYNNADTWINGHHLGFHPYGYSPFTYDLTPHLVEGENVIVVRADHTAYADSRWYTGAGIYRNVRLVNTDAAHIPVWGVFVTTPEVSAEQATVEARVELVNDGNAPREFELVAVVLGPDGTPVIGSRTDVTLEAGEKTEKITSLHVPEPELWDIDSPSLYTLSVSLMEGASFFDFTETRFGIRSFRFDPDKGFFLNGKNLAIKGVNLHHDGGLVGAAVPRDVWRRRFETLKEGGANAIRTAHNPPSAEFLDLADEMGFLVQNEFFDEWDYPKDKRFNQAEQEDHPETRGYSRHFREWAERDLKAVVRRDRNHPSVIQWSIGNEIEWTYPRIQAATGFFDNMNWQGNYFWEKPPFSPDEIREQLATLPKEEFPMGQTAKDLARWTREMDSTRPITANLILPSASQLTGYGESLDVMGYSYRRVLYDYGHELFPGKPIMGTENLPQYHEWKAVADRDFISGTFLWTGIRHLGELRGEWPVNTSSAGLLDLAGFPDWGWHLYRGLWRDEPQLVLATNRPQDIIYGGEELYEISADGEVVHRDPDAWRQLLWTWWPMKLHWNYEPGETVVVEAYSNADEIELFLDKQSLGTKKLVEFEDRIYKWAVPFAAGELKAVGKKGGQVMEYRMQTHGSPAAIKARVDRPVITANGYAAAHVEVQLVDGHGVPVRSDDRRVTFTVPDGLKVLGVDNGSPTNVQKFRSNSLFTSNGRALLIVQAGKRPGRFEIEIESEGLDPGMVTIQTESMETR